jgi:hypothetical protein
MVRHSHYFAVLLQRPPSGRNRAPAIVDQTENGLKRHRVENANKTSTEHKWQTMVSHSNDGSLNTANIIVKKFVSFYYCVRAITIVETMLRKKNKNHQCS